MGSALSSVIEVAFGIAWNRPIVICDDDERQITIRGPREALRYLLHDFPMRTGEAYWSALAASNRALLYRGHLERSRETFANAYAEYSLKARRQRKR